MKKWIVAAVIFLIASAASSAFAGEYIVSNGDTLWKLAKTWKVGISDIMKNNPEIKDKNLIFVGQKLSIPGQNAIAKVIAKKVWKNVGGDPYKGTAEWAIKNFSIPEDVKKAVLENIENNLFRWVEISSGMEIAAVTFGQNKIWTDVTTQWNPTKIHAAKNYGVGEYVVVKVLTCGNWAWWMKKEEVPPPVVVKEEPPVEEKKPLPPIYKVVKVEKTCTECEHEFDAGTGVWTNTEADARGAWGYIQYMVDLQNCGKGNINVFDGTMVPRVGVFGRGDLGETDTGYSWHSYGIGPEAGFLWTGTTEKGYPHQVQFMFRTLWEHLHGENSPYEKDEDHFLVGAYTEYLRRYKPDMMSVFYAEGYYDLSGSIDSTWSGDKASNRGGFVVGAKIHKDFNDDWAGRAGALVGFAPQDERWGLNLNLEARYHEWLMFGPSIDYTLSSAIPGMAGGISYGAFVRVELRHAVQKHWTETQRVEVKPAGHQLLNY